MASEVLELIIRVNGASQGASSLDRLSRSASSLTSVLRFMRNALVAISFARIAVDAVQVLDSFVLMQNKISLVTRNQQEMNVAMEALSQIAIRSRSPLDATVTLFTRMSRALTNLHLTYGELLDITEATNKALVISGATSDEARNAIIQFTQGLALGVLRGQDLRSVVEQAPRLAQVFAEGLSKEGGALAGLAKGFRLAGGQLYQFVTAHRNVLTSEKAIEAYKAAFAELGVEFDKTTPTIGQTFENLKTALDIFIGRTQQQLGLMTLLVQGIDFVRLHLNAFVEALVLIGGIVVFNFLLSQILRFGSGVVFTFKVIGSAILNLGTVLRVLATYAFSSIAAFSGFALVAAVVVGIIYAFNKFGVTMNDVLNFAEEFIANFIAVFQALPTYFEGAWHFWEGLALSAFNNVSQAWTDFLNHFRSTQQQAFQVSNPYAGTTISGVLQDTLSSIRGHAAENLTTIKGLVSDIQGYFNNLGKGGVTDDMIAKFRKLQAALSGTSDKLDQTKDKTAQYEAQILGLLRSVSPYADAQAKIAQLDRIVQKAEADGVDTKKIFNSLGLTQDEINLRLTRSALGVGNATAIYNETLKLLNEQVNKNTISHQEFDEQVRKARLDYLSFQRDVGSGIEAAVLKQKDTLANQEAIADSVVTQALAGTTALKTLAIQTDALNQAQNQGVITGRQYTETLRDLQIQALSTQTDTASGFVKGMLEAQKTINDTATTAAKVITDAFDGMTDAITNFVKTGKLSLGDLFDTIETDLIKLAVQESIMKPLANFLGLDNSGSSGSSSLVNGLTSLFGGGSGTNVGGNILPDIAATPQILGSSAGASSLFSSIGSLFGFATGGAFQVGGSGGTDSQLVAFRATPNERVTVETPDQQKSSGGRPVHVEIHLHGVSDFDSFRRSQGQVAAMTASTLQRASARNSG